MNSAQPIDEFKRRIGFAAVLALPAARPHPLGDSDALRDAIVSALGGTPPSGDTVSMPAPGAVTRAWKWPGAGTEVAVDATVTSSVEAARNLAVDTAALTMMQDIPYERGPGDLGDFSLVSLHESSRSWIWTSGDVCMRVRDRRHPQDGPSLPDVIQSFLNRPSKEPAPVAPQIAGLEVVPKSVRVGGKVRATLRMAPGMDPKSLRTRFFETEALLQPDKVTDWSVEYEAEKSGMTRLEVSVYDPKSLRSDTRSVELEVVPNAP